VEFVQFLRRFEVLHHSLEERMLLVIKQEGRVTLSKLNSFFYYDFTVEERNETLIKMAEKGVIKVEKVKGKTKSTYVIRLNEEKLNEE